MRAQSAIAVGRLSRNLDTVMIHVGTAETGMAFRPASLVLTAMLAVVAALPAQSRDKSGPNVVAATEHGRPGGVFALALARDLHDLALARGDAVTMLAAARLAKSAEVSPGEAETLDPDRIEPASDPTVFAWHGAAGSGGDAGDPITITGEGRPAAKARLPAAVPVDTVAAASPVKAEAMFAHARDLAAGHEALQGLIAGARAETLRTGGSVSRLSHLPPGQTDVWEIPFLADAPAEIAILGGGEANLDLAVTDEGGNMICLDVGWSDRLHCGWTPARDGHFYVTIRNSGQSGNSYQLLTN